MNFDDTPEEAACRAGARDWIQANAPKELEAELKSGKASKKFDSVEEFLADLKK